LRNINLGGVFGLFDRCDLSLFHSSFTDNEAYLGTSGTFLMIFVTIFSRLHLVLIRRRRFFSVFFQRETISIDVL
jgi:hypothetical protein